MLLNKIRKNLADAGKGKLAEGDSRRHFALCFGTNQQSTSIVLPSYRPILVVALRNFILLGLEKCEGSRGHLRGGGRLDLIFQIFADWLLTVYLVMMFYFTFRFLIDLHAFYLYFFQPP